MSHSNLIRTLRNKLGLSQTEFGAKLGVSRDVINNIENDRVPLKPALLKLICSVYHVDSEWFETGEGDPFVKKDNVSDLFDFATKLMLDPDLSWLRTVCEYVNELTPEEVAAVSRHIRSVANRIADKEKEQD